MRMMSEGVGEEEISREDLKSSQWEVHADNDGMVLAPVERP